MTNSYHRDSGWYNPNREDRMKVGDLVQNKYGEYGIVIRQIGVVDRWWVEWMVGTACAINGCNLWSVQ